MGKKKPYRKMGLEEWKEKFDWEAYREQVLRSRRAAEVFGRELSLEDGRVLAIYENKEKWEKAYRVWQTGEQSSQQST